MSIVAKARPDTYCVECSGVAAIAIDDYPYCESCVMDLDDRPMTVEEVLNQPKSPTEDWTFRKNDRHFVCTYLLGGVENCNKEAEVIIWKNGERSFDALCEEHMAKAHPDNLFYERNPR